MDIIPLAAVPSQQVNCLLGDQTCQITIRTMNERLYCDLYVNNSLVIGGVVCENRNRIVRDAYLGFVGDLGFIDTQGSADPDYAGLGSRYLFAYLTEADIQEFVDSA